MYSTSQSSIDDQKALILSEVGKRVMQYGRVQSIVHIAFWEAKCFSSKKSV